MHNESNTIFKFAAVDENKIGAIIDNLKCKASFGHDLISNKLIKSIKVVLLKPLTIIINQTLTTGIFPQELKISKVKPLFKKGDEKLICNYRPISLLP